MTLRVGIIGTGSIGTDHARMLAGRVGRATVVAVTDVDGERAGALAAELGARHHADHAGLIADADVDAVVIASSGPAHAAQARACIAAGKPVLCEKPLAPTPAEALTVVQAEVAADRRLLQVGFMRRFDPGYLDVKGSLDAGVIGVPLLVHCVHRNPTVPPGFTPAMGLTDSMVHELDIVRWLLDDEIIEVQVLLPHPSPNGPTPDYQDPQLAVLRMSRGVLVDVEVLLHGGFGYDVRCEVVGSKGVAALENPRLASYVSAETRREAVPSGWKTRFADTYRIELQAWVNATLAGTVVGASAWDGYAASAAAAAAVEAQSTSGTPVVVAMEPKPALYA